MARDVPSVGVNFRSREDRPDSLCSKLKIWVFYDVLRIDKHSGLNSSARSGPFMGRGVWPRCGIMPHMGML
jgi:hypothetical protein